MSSLEHIRQQRESLLNELDRIATSPRDIESATQQVMASIELTLQAGESAIGACSSHQSIRGLAGDPLLTIAALIGRPTLASLARQHLAAATANGITTADRQRKIADLKRQVAEIERDEELAVLELEAAGKDVMRRPDADPALLLQIWDPDAPQPRSGVFE